MYCSLRKFPYLSFLFSWTLHSVGCTFPFFSCILVLFFSHLTVKSLKTTALTPCISFSWGWFWSLCSVQCYEPLSVVLQVLLSTRSNPLTLSLSLGLPLWLRGKESICSAVHTGDLGLTPGLGRSRWRRKWQSSPVFLPGRSYGQRSLEDYSLCGSKESDTTEHCLIITWMA